MNSSRRYYVPRNILTSVIDVPFGTQSGPAEDLNSTIVVGDAGKRVDVDGVSSFTLEGKIFRGQGMSMGINGFGTTSGLGNVGGSCSAGVDGLG